MRRRGLWAACVVLLLLGVGVLLVGIGTGSAKDEGDEDARAKCSEATLNGTNANGETFRNERFSGTYTVKADCTGTAYGELDLFIAPDGSMFTFVQIKPKSNVTSGFELQGTAKRVGD